MKVPTRVLIADDSPTMRAILEALLAEDGDIRVVGHAKDGLEAVRLAKSLLPDLVTMDVQMPHLDGLDAIAAIMAEAPCRILVVCAVDEERAVRLGFEAMAAGALELIAKRRGDEGDSRSLADWGRDLRESVRLMAEIPVVGRRRRNSLDPTAELPGRAVAVGVVASTGGPPALAQLLSQLPADLPAPVFIAQHMAPGFARGLARWLAESTRLKVRMVERSTSIEPGHVYLPPDAQDLLVLSASTVSVTPGASMNCPSGDRLLQSIAQVFRAQSLGIVLTGMGDDGVAGLHAIREAGGLVLAQDEASSVVYGMAAAAHRAGVVARSLPLHSIAAAVHEIVRKRPGAQG